MYCVKGCSWSRRRRVWNLLSRCLSAKAGTSSREIRRQFLAYFIERHGHEYVHSSSVLPLKGQGTYFTNAGMNQFKPVFLGTVDVNSEMCNYRRVVNCQKCVRVGGKHNDLDDVGKDLTHHTFFEMLGNWSFGDYFKTEACSMALQLLTEVYGLPRDNLYVTYFGGNASLDLPADEDCKEVWLSLGMPPDRVLPFGMKDNFWDMGTTGPCGPCSEIHYDHVGDRHAASLVNTGSPDVVELWNLVFMQFDRQADQTLTPLPRQHIDTGMGLERLCAVLQGTRSNYNTDLFLPLFDHIRQASKAPEYQGRTGPADEGGMDTAYRIVADHARMFTVTVADGLMPGYDDLEHKLRHILHRCVHQAHHVLRLPRGRLSTLVDVVVDTLGDAYPEVSKDVQKIKDVVNITEERYLSSLAQGRKTLEKFLNTQTGGHTSVLSGEHVLGLCEGRYGPQIPLEVLTILAEEKQLSVDTSAIDSKLEEDREISHKAAMVNKSTSRFELDQHALQRLKEMGVSKTEDSGKYNYSKIGNSYDFSSSDKSSVCALLHDGKFVERVPSGQECGVILDRTSFYSEGGGQVADQGEITTEIGTSKVTDVQSFHGYVLHIVNVTSGEIAVGGNVLCKLNQSHREGCMRNHTATHLLNFALREVLGHDGIRQMGSLVTPHKLMLDFSDLGNIESGQLENIEICVRQLISDRKDVMKTEMSLTEARRLPQLVKLENELYPPNVRVVSVRTFEGEGNGAAEKYSVELCGGTHVENTGDLGEFCVTRLSSVSLGTKRVTAVTGSEASQALATTQELERLYARLEECVRTDRHTDSWREWEKQLYKGLSEDLVQKTKRDTLLDKVRRLGDKMSQVLNKEEKTKRKNEFEELLDQHKDSPFLVCDVQFDVTLKQMMKTIQGSAVFKKPAVILSRNKNMKKGDSLSCLFSIPQGTVGVSSEELEKSLVEKFGGRRVQVKGKHSAGFHLVMLNKPAGNTDSVIDFVRRQLSAVS